MENQIKKLAGELLSQYRAIAGSIKQMSSLGDNVSKADSMSKVRANLETVKTIEQELFPLRDQFLSSGQKFGPETAKLFEDSASEIASLLPVINQLEKAAMEEREKLAPEIHDSVRGLQMQSAYTQNQ